MIISIVPTGPNKGVHHSVTISTPSDDQNYTEMAELLISAAVALGYDQNGFCDALAALCRQKTKLLSEPPSEL